MLRILAFLTLFVLSASGQEWSKKCDKENAQSCAEAAMFYYNLAQNGDQRHLQRAFEYATKACEFKSGAGCNILAHFHDNGIATKPNPKKAIKLYDNGCNIGFAGSCHNLADIYASGILVKKNYKKAQELYQKACAGGAKESCRVLGAFLRRVFSALRVMTRA